MTPRSLDGRMYRLKAYLTSPRDGVPLVTDKMSRENCEGLLADLIDLDVATGGHLEEYVSGVGWVVETPGDVEAVEQYEDIDLTEADGEIDLLDPEGQNDD